jgi:NADPH:quinone reductase-like Zn-dependent oxidoreductase
VDQVGSGVWDWRVGDKVVVGISAMNGDGCHADIVDVYPSCTARISTKHFDQFTVEEWASVGFTGVCARIAAEHALKSASLKSVAVVGGAGATGFGRVVRGVKVLRIVKMFLVLMMLWIMMI